VNTFVVTPYFDTKLEWLQLAHDSVRAQTHKARHVLVCDGSRPAQLRNFNGIHILLPRNYRDYGNTPRLIGCFQAITGGAEAIAFLDADNWYYPGHLAALTEFAAANDYAVCSSGRMLHRLDGSPMMRCPHVDGRIAIDTNCLLVRKPAFPHLLSWVLAPHDKAAEGDQVVWRYMLDRGMRFGFLDQPTVAYRTRHSVHYRIAGEAAPDEAITRHDLHGDRYQ
jgi:hypothetical protein